MIDLIILTFALQMFAVKRAFRAVSPCLFKPMPRPMPLIHLFSLPLILPVPPTHSMSFRKESEKPVPPPALPPPLPPVSPPICKADPKFLLESKDVLDELLRRVKNNEIPEPVTNLKKLLVRELGFSEEAAVKSTDIIFFFLGTDGFFKGCVVFGGDLLVLYNLIAWFSSLDWFTSVDELIEIWAYLET